MARVACLRESPLAWRVRPAGGMRASEALPLPCVGVTGSGGHGEGREEV